MLDKSKIREMAANYTQAVRQNYNPKQIILFGLYVNGTPHANSDIDIAVIFDHIEGDFLEQWGGLIRLSADISYDIEAHLLDETSNKTGFLEHIQKNGEIIYSSQR